jgi:hypothetical protein
MSTTDLHHSIEVAVGLAITAIADGEDAVGAIIDTANIRALEYIIQVGGYTDGSVTPLIEGSDASDMSGAVALDDKWLLGTEAGAALSAADVSKIGVVSPYRYIRLTAVTAAGSTLTVGASAIKYGLQFEGEV